MAPSVEPQQESEDNVEGPVLTSVDGRRFMPLARVDATASAEDSADTVTELLAGNYTQDVVDEVKKYGKPEWDVPESSTLDPIDDIEDMYNYDFKLPPKVHDKYVQEAAGQVMDLEKMKGPVDPEVLAKIEQRKKLVEGRHADDVKWMKHKAYYRGMQKVRAAKKQLEQAVAEDAAVAAGQQQTAVAAPQQQLPGPRQQTPQLAPSLYSENEVLAAISDPSEWDVSYTAATYQQHPEVLQQLRSSFAACFGLPYVSPEQQYEQKQQLQQTLAQQKAEQQKAAEFAAAKEALVKKYTPYQVNNIR